MNIENAIYLYTELALSLAGFAGVSAAFAGRAREFRPVERLRLLGLMSLSGVVLAGCFAFIISSTAEFSEGRVLVVTAIVSFILTFTVGIIALPTLWRRSRDADTTISQWSLYFVSGLYLAEVVLLGIPIVLPGSAWMILLGFSLLLLHGLWIFVLFLTRPN